MDFDRVKRARLNEQRLFRIDTEATQVQDVESEETSGDNENTPCPIRRTADGKRLIIPLPKTSCDRRRSESRSSSSSRSSKSLSSHNGDIPGTTAEAVTRNTGPVLSAGEENINEEDMSENDWMLSEEGMYSI